MDGTSFINTGIAGTPSPRSCPHQSPSRKRPGRKPSRKLTPAEIAAIETACDQAVAAQAEALEAMSNAEKRALCQQAIALALRVVGCDKKPDDAERRRADLPGIAWLVLTDLGWARARAKKRIDAGYPPAIRLDPKTLARVAVNALNDQDAWEERQGRNADGKKDEAETAARWGAVEGEIEVEVIDTMTPDVLLESADSYALLWLLSDLESLVQQQQKRRRAQGGAA